MHVLFVIIHVHPGTTVATTLLGVLGTTCIHCVWCGVVCVCVCENAFTLYNKTGVLHGNMGVQGYWTSKTTTGAWLPREAR